MEFVLIVIQKLGHYILENYIGLIRINLSFKKQNEKNT